MAAGAIVRRAWRLDPLPLSRRPSRAVAAVHGVRSAIAALAAHRARSFMTMFGIIVGTCGVLVINVLGQAQNEALAEQMAQLGTNVISITPGIASLRGVSGGAGSKPTLTNRDAQLLEQQVPYLRGLTPMVNGSETLVFGGQTIGASVIGAYPDLETVQSYSVRLGAFFTGADESARLPVAVIGQTVVDRLLKGNSPIGAEIRIRGVGFRVVGVLQARGHQGQTDLDDVAIVPFSTAQQRLYGAKLDSILIQASRTEQIPAVMAAATAALDQAHHTASGARRDFNVQNFQQAIDAARQQTALLTQTLSIVAGVALAIGGFGVMNIMLLSVTERTAEIGLRMAVGARPADVLLQFLVEALTITVVAGSIGLVLGFALPIALRLPVHMLAQYPAVPTPAASIATFAVVVATGVVFGFFPALRAARLDPVVALRSE
jgi:putative ABC transport system permease protein